MVDLIASWQFLTFIFVTESNEIAAKIAQALKEYEPCEANSCRCHAGSITKSLYPFREGISKEMIDNVRKFGTKYQIIGHKIYRDQSCLFPARCSGIEHFLKENIQQIPDLEMIVNCRDWPQINIHYVIVLIFHCLYLFENVSKIHVSSPFHSQYLGQCFHSVVLMSIMTLCIQHGVSGLVVQQ